MTPEDPTTQEPEHISPLPHRRREAAEARILRVFAKAPAWLASAAIHALLIGILLQIGVLDRENNKPKAYQVGLSHRNDSELDRGDDSLDSPVPVVQPIINPVSFEWDEHQTESAEAVEDFATDADIPRLIALYGNYGMRSKGGRADAVQRGGGTAGSERAVELALEWLQRHQNGTTGAWQARAYKNCCIRGAECKTISSAVEGIDPGLTGLAALSFLGAGHTNQYGRFKTTVSKALRYMFRIQGRDGCFGHKTGSPAIYNHAICTLAMSEAYGMTQDRRYKASAKKGITYLLRVQHTDGGWGYVRTGGAYKSDVSVTGWVVMALKSAEMAGIEIPDTAWRSTMAYIDSASNEKGLSGYTPQGQIITPLNPSTIAVGLLCRQFAPGKVDPAKGAAISDALVEALPRSKSEGFFYYTYYGSLSLFQYGGPKWRKWNNHTRDLVVERQQQKGCEAGSWDPDSQRWASWAGRVYSTTMAALALEVYYRYLPIHRGYAEKGPEALALKKYRSALEAYRACIKLSDAGNTPPQKLIEARDHAVESLEAYRRAATELKAGDEKGQKPRQTRLAATAIRLATLHLRNEDYGKCIQEIENFAHKYPDYEDQETPKTLHAGALALMAKKLDGEGDGSKAAALRRQMVEKHYNRIIRNPDQPLAVYMMVAEDFYSREDWWRGAAVFSRILERFADDPQVGKNSSAIRLRLAKCLLGSGNTTDALKAFEALYDEGKSVATLEGLAECCVQTRKFDKALQVYLELRRGCKTAGPKWWGAQYNIANTLMLLGRTDECRRLIATQKELRPQLGGPEMRAKFERLLLACARMSGEIGAKNTP